MAYTSAQLVSRVQQVAAAAGIIPAVAVEQLRHESDNWRADVVYGPFVGGAGERGVAQFTPGTWQRFGRGAHTNAYDPEQSLAAYVRYMTYLLGLFNGDYSKALTGYNGGEGHLTNPVKYGGPSRDAQKYAQEILARSGAGAAPNWNVSADQPSVDDGEQPGWVQYWPLALVILGGWWLLDD